MATDDSTSNTPLKTCTKCQQEYPLVDEFWYRNKRSKSGYQYWCKECAKKHCRDYAHRPEVVIRRHEYNRDPLVVEKRRERQQTSEHKEYQRTYQHTEKRKKAIADWKKRNRNRMRSYVSKWQKSNPLNGRAHSSKRRALKKQSRGTHTSRDIEIQYKSQKGRCWWCNKRVEDKYHVDHIIPLVRGGSNAPENIVIACPFCNQSKHDKLPQEWNGRLF